MGFFFKVLLIASRLLTAAAWKLHLNPAFWVVLPVQREYECLTRGPQDPLTSTTTRSWNLLALLGGRKKGCNVIQMALWDNFKTSANSFHPGLICRSYLKMVKCCCFFFYLRVSNLLWILAVRLSFQDILVILWAEMASGNLKCVTEALQCTFTDVQVPSPCVSSSCLLRNDFVSFSSQN